MDWIPLDKINQENWHYAVVAARNHLQAARTIPELLAIRECIQRIDNMDDPERLERNELRADLVEDYERKVKEIGDLCDHDWQEVSIGGIHFDDGEVWDDYEEAIACSKCGLDKVYLDAPSAPEPVTF